MSLSYVLRALDDAPSKLNVVILDCCRNNPYARSWSRSRNVKGLAAVSEVPAGTMIAFSTAPGMLAADGAGENSPYTAELVRVLRSRPGDGLELVAVFRQASQAVKKAVGQTPWLNMDATLPEFYLWRSSGTPVRPQPTRRAVTARFAVREQDERGPPVSGATLELLWRRERGSEAVVLAQGTSDSQGKTEIELWLDAQQQAGGEFLVLVSSGRLHHTSPLRGFPDATELTVYVPRPVQPAPPSPGALAREITNSIGMKLVLIPAGEFMMGSPESEKNRLGDEGPVHRVRITRPFYLGKYEVTVGEFREFVRASGYKTDAEKNTGYEGA